MSRRAPLAVACAATLALVAGHSSCGGSAPKPAGGTPPILALTATRGIGDAAAILALSRSQANYIAEKNWKALYNTFSPKQHQTCPYDQFLQAIQKSPQSRAGFDVTKFAIDEFRVRFEGDTGYATYVVRFDGHVVDTATDDNPDVFVKVNGEWKDELDSHARFNC